MDKKFQELIAKANQGDLSAQWELAIAYFEGEVNGEPQISEGCKYLDMAANSGNPEVQCLCANVYKAAGFHSMAFGWYEKAAEQGHAESQAMLANYYFSGGAGKKDDLKALYWAEKAYNAGEYKESCIILGVLYLQGKVVETDGITAYKMLKMALQNGNELAEDMVKQMELQFPQLKNL